MLAEKKDTPILRVTRHMELARQISALTEDLEELKGEKAILVHSFDKADYAGMKEIKSQVESMEASMQKVEQAEVRFSSELNAALTQYRELTEQAADMDAAELDAARAELRPAKTADATDRVKAAYSAQYDFKLMQQAKSNVTAMLNEDAPTQGRQPIRQQLREVNKRQEQPGRRPKEREQER